MEVKKIIVGDLLTNCYILISGSSNIIIDPGAEPENIYRVTKDLGKVKYILLTHAHFDHVLGLVKLKQLLPDVKIALHSNDFALYSKTSDQLLQFLGKNEQISLPHPDLQIEKQSELIFNNSKIKIIHTPGHTSGSVSYIYKNRVFVGDLVFDDGFLGRTDLEGGNDSDLKESVDKILKLPDSTIVYPGHGESFTIKEFKKYHK